MSSNKILQMPKGATIFWTRHDRSDEAPRRIGVSPLTLKGNAEVLVRVVAGG